MEINSSTEALTAVMQHLGLSSPDMTKLGSVTPPVTNHAYQVVYDNKTYYVWETDGSITEG